MLAPLRSRDFRLLWLGQSASVIGDALIVVAIGLYVTRLTGDPADVGVVLLGYSLPLVAFVLVGGVVADRLPRQIVMIVADVVRGSAHAVLAVLIATGAVRIWHMVLIGIVYSGAQAFFQPAYSGLVPQTVGEGHIQEAQALGGVTRELAYVIGPALATALVLGVGGAAAFGLDAVTFAISALTLARVRPRPRGAQVARTTVLTELREGWAAVRQRAWVWGTLAAFSTSILVALAPFFVLGAAVGRDVYGREAVFGIANTAWGVGTLTGALLGARLRPRRPMFAGMLAAAPWPAFIALYAAGPPLPVLYAAMAVGGAGMGMFAVWWETALAQRIPPHLLSRVSAWDWMGSLALLPIGYLLAGPLARAFGDQQVMLYGGLLGLAACLAGLLPRETRTLPRLDATPVIQEVHVPVGSA